jgi:protein phosphatase
MDLPSGDGSDTIAVRSVLTSAAGAQEHPEVHLKEQQLISGDLLLLCSDGLYNCVSADHIVKTLNAEPSVAERSSALVEAARSANAPDNISVIVLEYREARQSFM